MNKHYFYLDMETHFLDVPYLGEKRRIRVLLPKDYHADTERRYPVVYMHDGQNVFYSKEAFTGYSWKVIPTLKRNPDIPRMIVVGIDNHISRLNEYAPWRFSNVISPEDQDMGGKGLEYAEFVMEVVKPFIDKQYRTKADRKHTAMVGSSLGGNITQFMGVVYQEQIGSLGVFSSANWLNRAEFDRFIKRHRLAPDQRVYIQVGTDEGDDTDATLTQGNIKQLYIDESLLYYRQLLEAGLPLEHIKLNVVVGAIHHEHVWASYLPECLRFLSEEWE
ncbi:alpha/beta hydrolase [Streptococcus ovuberis]|uniref:Alpha/beta hydrolase n=1 Tax=Streptococcus ovuberis TaxID=1936207 RepID=A0A7X6MZA2_9STRE|nr:alpha/beta hydrolase-fold protein [Streptococcus ovuberis]NKZ20126.1 alpha/beta hydrolase [Streptococcus ovuberis]